MYAEIGPMFPYCQNISHQVQQLEDYRESQNFISPGSNITQLSTISDYDLGGEGDLFEAPEPIIDKPVGDLNPMTAAISTISCCEDVITPQGPRVADIECIQSEELLDEVFYECKRDLLKKAGIETPLSEILDIKVPVIITDGNQIQGRKSPPNVPFQKQVSLGPLNSMDWMHGTPMETRILDFPGVDFGSVYGIRRAFSEGDIEALGNGNVSVINSSLQLPLTIGNCTTEERREKLSRYRDKKSKRNFGRKIKYACRKALADSQPRIRGRFAKTEEFEASKKQ